MTNQTIPPCPLCGTVPEVDAQFDDECKPRCGHIRSSVATIMIDDWTHSCNYELGRACRELGIETVEQLRAKMQPDPRVAVLDDAKAEIYHCDECGKLRSKDQGGTIFTVCDSCWDEHYKSIAAQHREVEG